MEKLKSKDAKWNKQYDRYILRGNLLIRRRELNEIKKTIKKIDGVKTILDIGCGMGTLVHELSRLKYKVKGIDCSTNAIRFAKRAYGDKFIEKDIEIAFLKDNSVDIICLVHTLQHIKEPIKLIDKLKKVCKKALIIIVPNKNSIRNDYTLWSFNEKDFDNSFKTEIFNGDKLLIATYIKKGI